MKILYENKEYDIKEFISEYLKKRNDYNKTNENFINEIFKHKQIKELIKKNENKRINFIELEDKYFKEATRQILENIVIVSDNDDSPNEFSQYFLELFKALVRNHDNPQQVPQNQFPNQNQQQPQPQQVPQNQVQNNQGLNRQQEQGQVQQIEQQNQVPNQNQPQQVPQNQVQNNQGSNQHIEQQNQVQQNQVPNQNQPQQVPQNQVQNNQGLNRQQKQGQVQHIQQVQQNQFPNQNQPQQVPQNQEQQKQPKKGFFANAWNDFRNLFTSNKNSNQPKQVQEDQGSNQQKNRKKQIFDDSKNLDGKFYIIRATKAQIEAITKKDIVEERVSFYDYLRSLLKDQSLETKDKAYKYFFNIPIEQNQDLIKVNLENIRKFENSTGEIFDGDVNIANNVKNEVKEQFNQFCSDNFNKVGNKITVKDLNPKGEENVEFDGTKDYFGYFYNLLVAEKSGERNYFSQLPNKELEEYPESIEENNDHEKVFDNSDLLQQKINDFHPEPSEFKLKKHTFKFKKGANCIELISGDLHIQINERSRSSIDEGIFRNKKLYDYIMEAGNLESLEKNEKLQNWLDDIFLQNSRAGIFCTNNNPCYSYKKNSVNGPVIVNISFGKAVDNNFTNTKNFKEFMKNKNDYFLVKLPKIDGLSGNQYIKFNLVFDDVKNMVMPKISEAGMFDKNKGVALYDGNGNRIEGDDGYKSAITKEKLKDILQEKNMKISCNLSYSNQEGLNLLGSYECNVETDFGFKRVEQEGLLDQNDNSKLSKIGGYEYTDDEQKKEYKEDQKRALNKQINEFFNQGSLRGKLGISFGKFESYVNGKIANNKEIQELDDELKKYADQLVKKYSEAIKEMEGKSNKVPDKNFKLNDIKQLNQQQKQQNQ